MWIQTLFSSLLIFAILVIIYCILKRKTFITFESAAFAVGYFLYTKTKLGFYFHQHQVKKCRKKYPHGHSISTPFQVQGLKICPVPVLSDNYAYVVIDTANHIAVAVDPADAQAINNCLHEEKCDLAAVLVTHKHWDHSGGNKEIRQSHRNVIIYGNPADAVPELTHPLGNGDVVQHGNLTFTVKSTPGHTVGHVVYRLDGTNFNCSDSLFTGDLLFIGGCGKNFEGSSAVMLKSLDSLLELPPETLVWPGHEYSLKNLQFSIYIDPNNRSAQQVHDAFLEKRRKGHQTCPSTIGEEKNYNPFLYTGSPKLHQCLGLTMGVGLFGTQDTTFRSQVLQELRNRKDRFRLPSS